MGTLHEYLVGCLVHDANILRDSTLQRLGLMHFGAYVHTLAISWVVVFEELRALTNATMTDMDPMELHGTLDHLWRLAGVIKGDGPFAVLAAGYRPWPKLTPSCEECRKWYDRRDDQEAGNKAWLLTFKHRHEGPQYNLILKKVMCLRGGKAYRRR